MHHLFQYFDGIRQGLLRQYIESHLLKHDETSSIAFFTGFKRPHLPFSSNQQDAAMAESVASAINQKGTTLVVVNSRSARRRRYEILLAIVASRLVLFAQY